MKKPIKLEGIYPALITPMHGDGSVDYDGLKQNIEFCLDAGCAGVVALGSTGEAVNLTGEERAAVTKLAIETCKARGKKTIVGTGAPITRTAVVQTKEAMELGADAALVITPFNNIPKRDGLIEHYRQVSKVGIPVILYNLPSHTGVEITMDVFDELIQIPNIIGIKESSGNLPMMADIIRKYGDDVTIFTGCDDLTLPIFAIGAKAAVLALANVAPKEVVGILNAVLANDFAKAREIYLRIMPISVIIAEGVNFPSTVKESVKQLGRPSGAPRLPITDVDPEKAAAIREALQYAGLL